jgi:signal transduction histidine kinase
VDVGAPGRAPADGQARTCTGTSLVTRPPVLGGLLAVATVLFALVEPGPLLGGHSLVSAGISLAACACVLGMRRWPWRVMAAATVYLAFYWLWPVESPMAYVLVAVGCFSVGAWARRAHLSVPLVGALSVAIGLAARQQGQVMAQLRSQHERLAVLQERETQAAVVTERTRIARELHDVVAHHISALLIQAQAGQRLADRAGTAEAERWRQITDVARETLQSMRRLVGLLRAD